MSAFPRLAAFLIVVGAARAQVTQLVSVSSSGIQGNNHTVPTGITPDGRFVAFYGYASNLVAGDANGRQDVFVRDRTFGVTDLVSVSQAGVQGNDDSVGGWIISIGRQVAFTSWATNLVPGDTNGVYDAFIRDRQLNITERLSVGPGGVEADNATAAGPISSNGHFVILVSLATNLTGVPTSGQQVFVRDRATLTNELVSVSTGGVQGDGPSYGARISGNGRYVSFLSEATNLVAGDTNGVIDVFLRDRTLGTTERVNVSTAGAEANNGFEVDASVSDDGNLVAFTSDATNLVAGDTNSAADVFLRDRLLATTVRISVDSGGAQGDRRSYGARISGDGNHVVFTSSATNLVPNDTSGSDDCFLHDLALGTTERVSLSSAGTEGDAGSTTLASPSPDGRFIAFTSLASNLAPGDTNHSQDTFVRIVQGGTEFFSLCDPGVNGVAACPCANPPAGPGRGCDNTFGTGGAALTASGGAFLSSDTLVFTTNGERPTTFSLVLQGTMEVPNGAIYGKGVRCAGGSFKRLYAKVSQFGSITAPAPGDLSVSARSAQLGHVIPPGEGRWYLVAYRDPAPLGGCPPASTFNATQTGVVYWYP